MVSKGISILGSTGSIGCNTLRVIETLAEPRLRVVALAAAAWRRLARGSDSFAGSRVG
jgi:1-deoxy-D-xylulose 5-phosphate reductoisomerase